MEQYCIEADDRVCHGVILFVGTKEECLNIFEPGSFFGHKKYGGIDAHLVKYDERCKSLPHDIH